MQVYLFRFRVVVFESHANESSQIDAITDFSIKMASLGHLRSSILGSLDRTHSLQVTRGQGVKAKAMAMATIFFVLEDSPPGPNPA